MWHMVHRGLLPSTPPCAAHTTRSENSLLFLAQATRYRPLFRLSHVGGGLGSASFSARAVGGHASRRASLGRGARWIHRTLSCTMSTWNSASPRQAGEAPFPLGMQEGLVGLSITASKKKRDGTCPGGCCAQEFCQLPLASWEYWVTPVKVAKLQDGPRGHFSCFWSCFSFCSADCHSNSVFACARRMFLRPPCKYKLLQNTSAKKRSLN